MSDPITETLSQKYKILIVDDEHIILNIASDALQDEGYNVETCSDPRDALEKIKSTKFDFVLTDIKMPHMDGMTLAKEAQKVDPDLGMIFMTGYASLDTAKSAIEAGAYDYIMKPFELTELRSAVAKAAAKKAKLEESSGGQDLKRLSDLMEVLYNVGDRDSLLKLSLGLALLKCNLEVGLISAWDERSSQLQIAATNNVKDGSFNVYSQHLSQDDAEKCFDFESPLRCEGMNNNPFFNNLSEVVSEIKKYSEYFSKNGQIITLAVKSRKKFYVVLTLQENPEEPLSDRDFKLLSIVLSLISLAAENIALFEESQKALSELEKLHDDIVNLEKVATKGLMSAEIGHELNNFLNIVRSNFEILTYKANIKNTEEIEKYITSINGSLDQMTKFTTGLADSANQRIEMKKIDLNSLIDDIVSFLAPQKRFRNIDLSKTLDSNLPEINADPSQLTQLFYNILNNGAQALKKTESPKLKIATRYLKDNNQVMIEIADNGPGIPQDLIDKAFNSRFTTKSGGHGFGLIVCGKVVNNHKGKIDVKHGKTNGTIFSITLPTDAVPKEQPEEVKNETSKIRI